MWLKKYQGHKFLAAQPWCCTLTRSNTICEQFELDLPLTQHGSTLQLSPLVYK